MYLLSQIQVYFMQRNFK